MKELLSNQIRIVANRFLFAAGLTGDILVGVLEKLKELLKEDDAFEPTKDQPLTFSRKGLQKLRGINPALKGPLFQQVIMELDNAIKLAVKSGNKDLEFIDGYLSERLRRAPDKWINMKLTGMEFELARDKALANAIAPVLTAMSATVPRQAAEKNLDRNS